MAEPALAIQIGGDHYKRWPIQPVEFAEVNDLSACQASIIKYVMRYDVKDGAKDLRKAAHYCELMVEISDTYELTWSRRDIEWRGVEDDLPSIPLEDFIEANVLPPSVASILELVCIKPSPLRLQKARLLIDELVSGLSA